MKRILDKIAQPPGALPPRAQAWVLAALAIGIAVILLAFPGQADGPRPLASAAGTPAGAEGTPVPVGAVDDSAERLREAAARRAERRLQQHLGLPERPPAGLPPSPAPLRAAPGSAGGYGYSESGQPGSGAAYASRPATAAEEIEREERLRRYRALRTPPLVRSVRGEPGLPGRPAPEPPGAGGELPDFEVPAAVPEPMPEVEAPRPAALFRLREGEFLEAVLANRLSGEFAGPVNAMISADAYDRERRRVLVPRGARALGSAALVSNWDQSRLAVSFHRLVLPDGRSIALDGFPALSQAGETGLRDRVRRRYLSAFGAAGAVGALAGLSQAAAPPDPALSRLGAARLSTGAGLARGAERILDRYLNRLPRIAVREGHRLRIYLTADLALPAYSGRRAAVPGVQP